MEDKKRYISYYKKYRARNYDFFDQFVLKKASGPWIYDTEGKKYLDLLSCYSAVSVGHAHKKVFAAAKRQMKKGLTTCSGVFVNDETAMFLKELAELCGMDKVLFMNTGAEAVETAMKLARKWAYVRKGVKRDEAEIIFCEGNFHGRTIAIVSASTVPQYKELFGPCVPGIKKIPFGDAKALWGAITPNTAAFIVEPIQGEGGINIPPDGYLSRVRGICNEKNVLFIADEVQTGLGRTGDMFACDYEGIKPDVYILGKALGGGFPISAVVSSRKIMDVFVPGDHGSTFGGNPFSCAVGRAAVKVIQKEKLAERAKILGKYFKEELNKIVIGNSFVKGIRGRGLLIGIELTEDGPPAQLFIDRLFSEGIICGKTSNSKVIRIAPPLMITKKQLDFALSVMKNFF